MIIQFWRVHGIFIEIKLNLGTTRFGTTWYYYRIVPELVHISLVLELIYKLYFYPSKFYKR